MSTMRPRAVQRQVLTDSVYESVKELVMDHHIPPGARIGMSSLTRLLDVSHTPVREALARLESDGLIIREPLRGYRTAPLPNADSLRQLFTLRLLLEPHAASEAAKLRGPSELKEMQLAHETIGGLNAGRSYKSYRPFVLADARFHDAIAVASGNEMLRAALDRLRLHTHLFRLYSEPELATRTALEHAPILDAIRGEDGSAAHEAMATHLERSRDRLIEAADAADPD